MFSSSKTCLSIAKNFSILRCIPIDILLTLSLIFGIPLSFCALRYSSVGSRAFDTATGEIASDQKTYFDVVSKRTATVKPSQLGVLARIICIGSLFPPRRARPYRYSSLCSLPLFPTSSLPSVGCRYPLCSLPLNRLPLCPQLQSPLCTGYRYVSSCSRPWASIQHIKLLKHASER